jgi:hypothetical protein
VNGAAERRANAVDRFEALHWGRPARKSSGHQVQAPRALAEIGRLEAVEYFTNKRGDGPSVYRHQFGEDGGRKPRLAVDVETDRLHIIGGDYSVEDQGIVD